MRLYSIASLAFCFVPILALAADWPQFRGPSSSGRAQSADPLPTDIGPEKHVLWKTELPPGTSPAIVGDKIS
jgi:hypothetical protein